MLGKALFLGALVVGPVVYGQQANAPSPFADTAITLRNGIVGCALSFPSASPRNYERAAGG